MDTPSPQPRDEGRSEAMVQGNTKGAAYQGPGPVSLT